MEFYGISFSYIIFWGAALATFVASIMAEEQNDRLRNGTFGAIAGSTMGGLAALLTKQDQLLLIGFFGASIGALGGWIMSIILSLFAAKTKTGRTMLEYQIGGWKAVRAKLELEDTDQLLKAMNQWVQNFVRQINRQKEEIKTQQKSKTINYFIKATISGWLVSIIDVLGLLFDLAQKEKYRSRVTIIIFGKRDNKIVGKHWLTESAGLKAHKASQEFDGTSIGFKVLEEKIASPYFTTGDKAKSEGQDRGEHNYRPFLTLRLNSSAILALDWDNDISEGDRIFQAAKKLFNEDICPMIGGLLAHWDGHIQGELDLDPLYPGKVSG